MEAEKYYKESYENALKYLGPQDSNTIVFRNTLIKFYQQQNKTKEAEELST